MFNFESYYLGHLSYELALAWQIEERQRVLRTRCARVLGVEHPTTITLGVRGRPEDLLSENDHLEDLGIEVHRVDRGGSATLHSPGQLVIYPLIPLEDWQLGAKDLVQLLLSVSQRTLARFGVRARLKKEAMGLYTDNGKIVFCGIRIKEGVSFHGISVNVSNNLALFKHIKSCGVSDERLDSLAHHEINASLLEIFQAWCDELKQTLIDAEVSNQPLLGRQPLSTLA